MSILDKVLGAITPPETQEAHAKGTAKAHAAGAPGARNCACPQGLLAIGGVVTGVLLSTAALAWAATSVARRQPLGHTSEPGDKRRSRPAKVVR